MSIENLSVKDLFTDNYELAFLVGAGCSVESPSCLPDARTMMEAIIGYTCAEPEIKKILKLKDLKFETLLEIIRDTVDPNLETIEYYGLCKSPNIHHYFLAEMLKKGHFVITTNFDILIEKALSPKTAKRIVLIIKREDIPKDFFVKKRKEKRIYLYKIHGSVNNIFKPKEDTKMALAKNLPMKTELGPYELYFLKQSMKGKTLVIMGYSGKNDFDIIPTLKRIDTIQNIIWFNHIEEDNGKEEIRINPNTRFDSNLVNDNVDRILLDISKATNIHNIYRIDTNTTKLLKKIIDGDPSIHHNKFSTRLIDWFRSQPDIKKLEKKFTVSKYIIPQLIYDHHNQSEDALRCVDNILQIVANLKGPDLRWKSYALNKIGFICKDQKSYHDILKWFKKISPDKLQDPNTKGTLLNYIGLIYLNIGRAGGEVWIEPFSKKNCHIKASEKFKEALDVFSKAQNSEGIAETLKNFGIYEHDRGDREEAKIRYDGALKIINELGLPEKKAEILHNKGLVSLDDGDYSNALKYLIEALKIFNKKQNFERKINCLYNMGLYYHYTGNNSEAQEILDKTMRITKDLDDLQKEALCHKTKGFIYKKEWNLERALEEYKKALEIIEMLRINEDKVKILNLKTIEEKVNILNRLGSIYQALTDYKLASNCFHEARSVAGVLNKMIEADCLNNIADLHCEKEEFDVALEKLYEALKFDEENPDNSKGKARRLKSIGNVYREQRKYGTALEYLHDAYEWAISEAENANIKRMIGMVYQQEGKYNDAIEEYEEAKKQYESVLDFDNLDREIGKAICLNNIGSTYKTIGSYDNAKKNYEEALEIYENNGDLPGIAIDLYNIGIIYHLKHDYNKALKHYEKALDVYKNLFQHLLGQISCQNKIALLYQCQRNYNNALEWYEKLLSIYKKPDNSRLDNSEGREEKAKTYYYTALIYHHHQKNYAKALDGYEKAFQLFDELGYFKDAADCLNCRGMAYLAQGKYPEAEREIKEAQKIYKQEKDQSGEATCLNSRGIVYHAQREDTKALNRIEDALRIYIKKRDKWGEAACLNNIGIINHDQEEYEKAEEDINEALEIYEKKDDLKGRIVCLNNLVKICEDQDKDKEARKHFDKADELRKKYKKYPRRKTKTFKLSNGFLSYHGKMIENKEFKEERMSMSKMRKETQYIDRGGTPNQYI